MNAKQINDDFQASVVADIYDAFYRQHPHPVLDALLAFRVERKKVAGWLGITSGTLNQYIFGARPLPPKHLPRLLELLALCVECALTAEELAGENDGRDARSMGGGYQNHAPRSFTEDEHLALAHAIEQGQQVLEEYRTGDE